MDERYSTKNMLVLRKLTRAVATLLRDQLKGYLFTLQPLLSPKGTLAHHIQSPVKETVRAADKALKDLQTLYDSLAVSKPFNLPKDLQPPLEVATSILETSPLEYTYVAKGDKENKLIKMTSPLKWVLSYSGFTPKRLGELLADRNRSVEALKEFMVHALIVRVAAATQTGVSQVLEGLHFPISLDKLPELGDLPIPLISSAITTLRPPDNVIIESTEMTGSDAFEEIVNLDDIATMRNPLKETLLEVVKSHGDGLLPGS